VAPHRGCWRTSVVRGVVLRREQRIGIDQLRIVQHVVQSLAIQLAGPAKSFVRAVSYDFVLASLLKL
jgi:hypothetical protein